MIKEKAQEFVVGVGEKLLVVAESRIKEQLPQIQAQVEGVVKEKIPQVRAQVEETVKEKGAQVATQVRTQAETQIRAQLSTEKMIPRLETVTGGVMAGDGLVTAPFLVGFVASGGLGGVLAIPIKLIRVVILRPIIGSRLEGRLIFNRNSKELGRALAALASADRRLRRRRGLIGLFLPSFRKVVLLGGAGAAYMTLQSKNGNGDILDQFEQLAPKLEKVRETVEGTELYAAIAPDIGRVVALVGERVDSIR